MGWGVVVVVMGVVVVVFFCRRGNGSANFVEVLLWF